VGFRNSASPERLALAGRIAALKRHHPEVDTRDLQEQLTALALEDHIRSLANAAPPLKPETRERLANLLRGSSTVGQAA
jgi:hypothetical protein